MLLQRLPRLLLFSLLAVGAASAAASAPGPVPLPAKPAQDSAGEIVPAPQAGEVERIRELLAELRAGDHVAVAAHFDLPLRQAERVARGEATMSWDDLDEEGRGLAGYGLFRELREAERGLLRTAQFVDAVALPDPDHGLGAVPDRRVLRITVRGSRDRRYGTLEVRLKPDGQLLDAWLLAPDDAQEPVPPVLSAPPPGQPAWPADHDPDRIEDLRATVDELVEAASAYEREVALQKLQRDGRAGATALLERLVESEGSPRPDRTLQAVLLAGLAHISGRHTEWPEPEPAGALDPELRAHNGRIVEDWLRWHATAGWTFHPLALNAPIHPTRRERLAGLLTLNEQDWLARRPAVHSRPETARPGTATPEVADVADVADVVAAEPVASAEDAPPPALYDAPLPDEPVADAPVAAGPVLGPLAAALEVRFGKRTRPAGEIAGQLSAVRRETLERIADVVSEHKLSVRLPEAGDVVIVGGARERLLDEAEAVLVSTHALLDPVLPLLEEYPERAILVCLFDEQGAARPGWAALLGVLVEERLLLPADAERALNRTISLVQRRNGIILQPTWDLAGEGEFQLGNEVAHKLAQVLVTQRVGELPPQLLWGFGYLAEQAQFKSSYQFSGSGFVFAADHFDWFTRTRQSLESRRQRRDLDFAALAVLPDEAGQPRAPQMITWALLAWLADTRVPLLQDLLIELSLLQDQRDPLRHATFWLPDPEVTQAALAPWLAELDSRELIDWLRANR